MAPALLVIFLGWDPTRTLIISQVVLSFGLPFAVVPLIQFTCRKDLMKELVNRPFTNFLACIIAGIIIFLNVYLLFRTFSGAA